ncbi:pyruvate kinase [Limisalsivibrio acetivorans]|uniref:pyruvate kinase n=1 Tax=Limisalsivibrio acetivorans TaxID=1304888 RepID=UPI0003B5224A|nr:pyruvate kinase [Limisalsivibrio acetivorans]
MKHIHRKTKVVCTYGPSLDGEGKLREIIEAGLDVIRLNFSHGNQDAYREIIKKIRKTAEDCGREIAILQDLGGPKIRVGHIPEEGLRLVPGETAVLRSGEEYDGESIPVSYRYIADDVREGDRILLADGTMEMRVKSIEYERVHCEVIHGGRLFSKKGINLPTSNLRIPAITEKDRSDLKFGMEQGIDIVAVSFVQNEADVIEARKLINESGRSPYLIAKIEKPKAILEMEGILRHVDGIMVARGDLGVEMPHEEVPLVQKEIIDSAMKAGKVVITATQMLSSMVKNPRPTRAETSDAANAIMDGSDALMLSDETAVGEYPVESVKTLCAIALVTEKRCDQYCQGRVRSTYDGISLAIGSAAADIAKNLECSAIVTYTRTGFTAMGVSRYRPSLPVIALAPDVEAVRKMRLLWAVMPVISPEFTNTDNMFEFASKWCVENNIAFEGSRLVITAGFPLGKPGTTNLIKILEI